jgi:hypothetical protein
MRSHRRWLALAVPAALAALVTAVPAASSAATTAPHVQGAASAAAGCEYISNLDSGGLEIAGNGVNQPVRLVDPPGNCFTRMYEFTSLDGSPGWEYQNGEGHCLWQNDGVIEVGAACKPNHPNEQFWGVPGTQSKYGGWLVSDMFDGTGSYMSTNPGCGIDTNVDMVLGGGNCPFWNFPS